MPIINCYVEDSTLATLKRVSSETGRSVTDLAEAAISEAACQAEVQYQRFAATNEAARQLGEMFNRG
jgi:hypothetical protein